MYDGVDQAGDLALSVQPTVPDRSLVEHVALHDPAIRVIPQQALGGFFDVLDGRQRGEIGGGFRRCDRIDHPDLTHRVLAEHGSAGESNVRGSFIWRCASEDHDDDLLQTLRAELDAMLAVQRPDAEIGIDAPGRVEMADPAHESQAGELLKIDAGGVDDIREVGQVFAQYQAG